MRVQDEWGKFETVEAIDDHDIGIYYGTYAPVSLREFYQFHALLPTRV